MRDMWLVWGELGGIETSWLIYSRRFGQAEVEACWVSTLSGWKRDESRGGSVLYGCKWEEMTSFARWRRNPCKAAEDGR
jgi:hypothetical protein